MIRQILYSGTALCLTDALEVVIERGILGEPG